MRFEEAVQYKASRIKSQVPCPGRWLVIANFSNNCPAYEKNNLFIVSVLEVLLYDEPRVKNQDKRVLFLGSWFRSSRTCRKQFILDQHLGLPRYRYLVGSVRQRLHRCR